MKTERLNIPASREFKNFVEAEAAREGISVAELVRRRVQGVPSDDEILLAELTMALRQAVEEARESVARGVANADAVVRELRERRGAASTDAPA